MGLMTRVLAIDAGTTGVRTLAADENCRIVDMAYRELTQHFPRPGWVEHDASEIWSHVVATLAEVAIRLHDAGEAIAAIGITNQRETVVGWDRYTGKPSARAIVWQDRRTASRCEELRAAGHLELVREQTGLVLDPYFSATKMAWMIENGAVEPSRGLTMGTVDSWVLWNLTGGPAGGSLATDPSNASRTLLYDIRAQQWSDELCELFGVPRSTLPEVRPTSGRFGKTAGEVASVPGLGGIPVSGIAGDQQAALFGQACFGTGNAKVTYGTGSFVLVNAGETCPAPAEGMLTTVAWDLGKGGATYATEGAVFATGAAIQWLRDGIGIVESAAEVGRLAESVQDAEGVFFVPAFTGLGSPWWDPHARGTFGGISRGTGRAHLARAVVESIAFQVRDVLDSMAASLGAPVTSLRVDGGASVMQLLLQLQADQLQVPVARPGSTETTSLGAAMLAGLAEGVWGSLEDLSDMWRLDVEVEPRAGKALADAKHDAWLRAVERSRDWARD
jgi:glycerol kinase